MPSPTSSSTITNVSPAGSLNIDALARGVKWGDAVGTGVTVSYSFPWVSGSAVFAGLNGAGSYSTRDEPATGLGSDKLLMQNRRQENCKRG